MKIGVVFPQTEFPADRTAVRDYAQAVEELGFTHVLAYDHVLGANPDRPGGWRGPYTHQDSFFDLFVLYSFMTAVTNRLGFVTGVLILPQRQTAVVAKQAACLDVLCEGRFRLGVGVGWNKVEMESIGQEFHTRGRRIEEQITVLNRLWTEELVVFDGLWHHLQDVGLNPLPVQQPIPIWIGGNADVVLRRTARLGDGWFPTYRSPEQAQPSLDKLDGFLEEYGRSRADLGIEARLHYKPDNLDQLQALLTAWRDAGATHISYNTMGAGLHTADEHIQVLTQLAALQP